MMRREDMGPGEEAHAGKVYRYGKFVDFLEPEPPTFGRYWAVVFCLVGFVGVVFVGGGVYYFAAALLEAGGIEMALWMICAVVFAWAIVATSLAARFHDERESLRGEVDRLKAEVRASDQENKRLHREIRERSRA